MAETASKPKRGRGRPPKARQILLPEMEADRLRDVEEAADDYVEVRDTRMAWTKKEIAASQRLMEVMKEHKLTNYDAADYVVRIDVSATEKVKVKAKKHDEDSNGEAD